MVIRDNISTIGEILETFQDMESIRKYREKMAYTKLDNEGNEGVNLETHQSGRGVEYKLYFRYPVKVLQNEIEMTPNCRLISDPSRNISVRTHQMNSDIGVNAIPIAKIAIEQ